MRLETMSIFTTRVLQWKRYNLSWRALCYKEMSGLRDLKYIKQVKQSILNFLFTLQ